MKAAPLAVWHFIENSVLKPIEGAFSDVVTFIKSHWELLAEILLAPVMPALALFLMFHTQIIGFFEDIVGKVKAVWDTITTGLSTFISGVVGFFDKLPGRIVSGISTIVSDIKAIWNTCTTDVSKFISGVVNFFTGLPSKIMAALGNIGSEIWKAITSHIPGGGLIHTAFTAVFGAEGGLITSPTLMVAGEAGPELLIPLNKLGGAGIDGHGFRPGGMLGSGRGGAGGGGVVNNFGPITVVANSPEEMVNGLIRYSRANGGIPIKVK
jgi:Flp pilus assembly pilin Flp